ncbi:uncharacterized protein OCT59_000302 [Rhizophagus irregularis]|uniref:uncharacterized protein n=1 Tax=Rhizophagus irregularis TaxID=588596 RepID=UPI00332F4A4E|nr:hypothetical protein OCT59_000302 [Rhizophagus irregularis]
MTYSKIFLGDLPELTSLIIQYFQNDFSTLYSCILVNRLWCRLAIPLLWEDPFSIPAKNCRFIEIYLYNSSEDDRAKINRFGINIIPSNTLFNYPSFIKRFNTHKFFKSIKQWLYTVIKERSFFSSFYLTELIILILIKIFVQNEIDLHTLEIDTAKTDVQIRYFKPAFNLILQNPNLNQNIKTLKLNCDYDEYIEEFSTQIIKSQQDLKKIIFKFDIYNLYILKSSNCLNTLKIIIFHGIDFKNIMNLKQIFEQLNVLDSIHIIYCTLNSRIIQQIFNMTKPFKLKTLFGIFEIKSLLLLLQKSGDYLENIRIETTTNNILLQQSFDLIKIYCTKIKLIDLYGFEHQDFNLALDLIRNIGQNLNYLSFDITKFPSGFSSHDFKFSSILLQNLGQILPYKLEYLNLIFKINASDFKIFLTNSHNIFIRKLLIRNMMYDKNEDILPYIKEYIMKEKRVTYFAMEEILPKEKKKRKRKNNLSSLQNEVKEFQLYNIKVQNYDDLFINFFIFEKKPENWTVPGRYQDDTGQGVHLCYSSGFPLLTIDSRHASLVIVCMIHCDIQVYL